MQATSVIGGISRKLSPIYTGSTGDHILQCIRHLSYFVLPSLNALVTLDLQGHIFSVRNSACKWSRRILRYQVLTLEDISLIISSKRQLKDLETIPSSLALKYIASLGASTVNFVEEAEEPKLKSVPATSNAKI